MNQTTKKESVNPVPQTATAGEVKEIGRIVYDVFDEGLRFIIMRGPASWCGYVGIPEAHPLAGIDYDDISFISAHGGLTFSEKGDDKNLWPGGYWWYGWDYAHAGDKTNFDYLEELKKMYPHTDDKNWTIEEVIKDSCETLYYFKKLLKFTEKIKK